MTPEELPVPNASPEVDRFLAVLPDLVAGLRKEAGL